MLMLARAVLGLIGFLAGWFFSYWSYFAGFDLAGRPFLGRGAPFLVGLACAAVILAATHRLQHGFLSSAVLGAVALGSIGFVIGSFDPGVSDPGGSAVSLPGLLPGAPGGALLGGALGALWWWWRQRRNAAARPVR